MGLDQYVFRFSKLSEAEQEKLTAHVISTDEYYNLTDSKMFFTDDEKVDRISQQIIDLACGPIQVTQSYYNLDKIFYEKYHKHLDKSYYVGSKSFGENSYHFSLYKEGDPDSTKYTLDFDDSPENFYDKVIDMQVLNQEEVYYWRKAYWIQDWFCRKGLYTSKDNTYYKYIDESTWKDLIKDLTALRNKETQADLLFGLSYQDVENFPSDEILADTIENLTEAIEDTDFNNEVLSYYEWW